MSLEEVLAKQAKAAAAVEGLARFQDDPEALMKAVAQVSEQIADLAKSAERLNAELSLAGGPEERVELTRDQRERIAEQTGVAMDLLVMRDPDGSFAKMMPKAKKHEIERLAARQATEIAMAKAKEKAVDDLVRHLKSVDAPGMDEIIAAIRKDPSLKELARQQQEAGRRMQEEGAAAEAAAPKPGGE
jgi:hypothetical protein